QFQPRAPRVVIENAGSQMRDCVVMGDLRCTKKACHETRQRAFLLEQNSNALAIILAKELRRERDNSARLLGGVGSYEKVRFVQLISCWRLPLRSFMCLGNRFRFAEDFFP